ncbi:flagellar M-ring protein FliF C-terminal domain-containing protein [Paractinoplanes hotanensis]|uniref:Flagellar M-ring C-terminal domain-containing protein n=1 Tax=Paractinoplanes hotanensis TaxID=2906497 RepID=A0ABT0XYK7_9ACTN|nr:flagellar M-ring protein FliF C-terminal domain-containing protein [Actinoplanes hotanensis]MCM4078878.1 hypothetical protein [Actinoplanes hotanensis]
MDNHYPGPLRTIGKTFKFLTPGRRSAMVVAGLVVSIGAHTSAAEAAELAPQRLTSADTQTAAFQNRLNASLQKMLDAIVGPGHAVVTTTAELNLDQVETATKTYTSSPSATALAERISRETYTANGATGYENTRTDRINAVNEINQTRRTAPGAVERLSVAVLLDKTNAGTINLAQLQQLVSAAVGIDRTRGDSIAVAAIPFDTSAAEKVQQALTDSAAAATAAKQQAQMKTAGLVLLVLILLLLAWRASRRATNRRPLRSGELERAKTLQVILEQHSLTQLNTPLTVKTVESARALASRRQHAIEQLAEEKPKEIAGVLSDWTAPRN